METRGARIAAASGAACGLTSHLIYLIVLGSTFFPGNFSWTAELSQTLLFQLALGVLLGLLGYLASLLPKNLDR